MCFAGSMSDAVSYVPDKYLVARRDVDAVLYEASHLWVLGVQPLLKTESEDWDKDGVLIVCWLGDATVCVVVVAHCAAASVAEERTEMLQY